MRSPGHRSSIHTGSQDSFVPSASGISCFQEFAGVVAQSTTDRSIDGNPALSLDSQFVQQTKDRIRELVNQITQASQSPIEPLEFWSIAFPRMISAMGAEGVALWVWRSGSPWECIHAFQLPQELAFTLTVGDAEGKSPEDILRKLERVESHIEAAICETWQHQPSESLPKNSGVDLSVDKDFEKRIYASVQHAAVLDVVRQEGQPVLVPPRDATLNSNRPGNPSDSMLLIAPVSFPAIDGELWLEIVQRPNGGPSAQRGHLRFAVQMSDLIGEFLKSHRLRHLERDQAFLRTAQELIDQLVYSPLESKSLSTLASRIREVAMAEHAFLLIRSRVSNRWRVVAVSGLDRVDRRAEGILCSEEAINAIEARSPSECVVAINHPSHTTSSLPALNTLEIDRWTQMFSIARASWIKPLGIATSERTETLGLLDTLVRRNAALPETVAQPDSHCIGLLIAWTGQQIPPLRYVEQCSTLIRLGLSISRPAWWQRWISGLHRGSHYRSSISGTWTLGALISLVVLSVLAIPVPIQIETHATLIPTHTKECFAPTDGVIEQVFIKHGDPVVRGQTLLKLQSEKLVSEYQQALANHAKSQQREKDIEERLLRDRGLMPAERDTLESERTALLSILQLEKQGLDLLSSQVDRLTIRATTDGVIDTWNVDLLLQERPVRIGQWLFTIRETQSQWELETMIPERDLGELRKASQNPSSAYARFVAAPQTKLVIHSLPSDRWRPAESADAFQQSRYGDRTNYLVPFRFEDPLPPGVDVSGATARVAINTGSGPLIWALSRDFIQDLMIRTTMWFR
jgi:hypothetical protein